ncbi:MAG TPA: hypothetical protein VLC74_07060 [Rhizomicrobium sp.]|nr:hypothetical protein [Rhizomicrobium sp.]
MAMKATEGAAAVLLPTAEPPPEPRENQTARAPSPMGPLIFAFTLAAFWMGAAIPYIFGYFGASGLAALPVHQLALAVFAAFAPPFLIVVAAWTFSRGQAMAFAAEQLVDSANRLFSSDETVSRTAARLGRAVRRELDGLNAGLDGAFARLRALESVLEKQIASLDEASARAAVRTETVSAQLGSERERIDGLTAALSDAASRSSELVAGRAAQLRAMIESAEGTLKSAGQLLETQANSFRAAAQSAAEAPHTAAVELDKQAKHIEQVSDATMARAEFVLGRHERHRITMAELLHRLEKEGGEFDASITHQRDALDQAINALSGQAKVFETMAAQTEQQLESIMCAGEARATQLAASFGREAERVKEICEAANATLAKLVSGLHDAGAGAQALINETTAEAKSTGKHMVGEAMAECQKLVRIAGELADQTNAIKGALAAAGTEIQKHIVSLPAIAQQETLRVREMVRAETEEMLNISARTLSTIHARNTGRITPKAEVVEVAPEPQTEGLLNRARKLGRPKNREGKALAEPKSWEMKKLLSAVDLEPTKPKDVNAGTVVALGALQAALADMAIDLDAMAADYAPPDAEEWRRYLSGDRTVFARRVAASLDESTIDRIALLNRENERFREAANVYIEEFEALMARAREGDNGGLLASTLLSADTGKIYLAIAYALGRLSS